MSFPAYESYRASGVEWLGKVPGHWAVAPLKRFVGIVSDRASEKTWPVGLENIESWSGKYLATGTEFEGDGISFRKNDILYGKLRPYLAKVLVAEIAGEAVGDFHVLRANGRAVSKFVSYFLRSSEIVDVLNGSTFGVRMPRVSWEFMGSMAVALPPPTEQTAITAFLDRETRKIDALVEEQKRLIELLKEKRQAVISHAVTKGLDPTAPMKDSGVEWLGEVPAHWKATRLSNVASFFQGKAHEPFFDGEGEHVCVTARFISTNGTAAKMSSENLSPAAPGDILMVMSDLPNGRALARSFLVRDPRSYAVNQRVCCISVREGNPAYFSFQLNRNQQLLQFNDGVEQTHLKNSAFTKLILAVPPPLEQDQIAAFLSHELATFDQLSAEADAAINLLQERRSALISAAVTGKIDVRGLVPSHSEAA